MDIEFFPDTSVLLIHGHDPSAVVRFRGQIKALATERIQSLAVHELPGFNSVGHCKLIAMATNADHGISIPSDGISFECRLRPAAWENVEWLLEPFSDGSYLAASHQYLDEHGKVRLIISGGRGW